jgi:hypothetical protein
MFRVRIWMALVIDIGIGWLLCLSRERLNCTGWKRLCYFVMALQGGDGELEGRGGGDRALKLVFRQEVVENKDSFC